MVLLAMLFETASASAEPVFGLGVAGGMGYGSYAETDPSLFTGGLVLFPSLELRFRVSPNLHLDVSSALGNTIAFLAGGAWSWQTDVFATFSLPTGFGRVLVGPGLGGASARRRARGRRL